MIQICLKELSCIQPSPSEKSYNRSKFHKFSLFDAFNNWYHVVENCSRWGSQGMIILNHLQFFMRKKKDHTFQYISLPLILNPFSFPDWTSLRLDPEVRLNTFVGLFELPKDLQEWYYRFLCVQRYEVEFGQKHHIIAYNSYCAT